MPLGEHAGAAFIADTIPRRVGGTNINRRTVSSADDYIKKLVDSAPPLTPEQRNCLAVLLRPDIHPQRDEVKKPASTVNGIVDEV